MKGIFTLLFALTLSVAVNAQTKIQKLDTSGTIEKNPELRVLTPSAKQSNAPKRKIEVGEGEHIMGFYDTDDLPYYSGGYLATGFLGSHPVANSYEGEVLSNFVGGEIMRLRFAVACDVYVSNAFIYLEDEQGYIFNEPIAKVDIEQTISPGWYDVQLDEPITIEEGYGYLIGFELTEVSGTFPLISDYELDVNYTSEYGFLIYMTYYGQTGWWILGDDYGSLCIQAVVKGGSFINDDLALRNLSVKKYVSKDSNMSYSFDIRNMGNNDPSSYTLNVTLDDDEIQTLDTPISVTSTYQTISGTVGTSNLSGGSHKLSVSVAEINGEVPTENTSDDEVEASFVVYEGDMPDRQKHLIEEFTSIYCQYCPLGAYVLETMMENNPDKYILVACHSIGMGSDTLALYQDDYLTVEYFIDLYSYPSADFDRAQLYSTILRLTGDVCCSIGYYSSDAPVMAEAFDVAIDEAFEGIPAFASVDIDSKYNADTRELKITVRGEGSEMAKELLDGNRLTIYLTEDGIQGRQYTYSETTGRPSYQDVVHDNVLRAIPTTYEWGDDIEWTSNSSYVNTVTTTLPAKWDDSQIYITAFISGPMAYLQGNYWYLNDVSEGMVNNANRVKATDVPAGISAVTVNTDDVVNTYYTTDGRLLSAPVKGVNILKSSDGTVKKVYVK